MNQFLHFSRIPGRHLSRAHLSLLVLCALGMAVPHFHAQQTAAAAGVPKNLHLYLHIGQSNMAGRAVIPEDAGDIKFIDPHVHAMSVTPLGLRAVAKWMEERNVERCIVSPLNHKGSRPQNEEERASMLANFRPYKGKIDRMALIDPGDVETVDQAVTLLKREIADGAIAFGEHYGVDLMFDDPKNLMLYEAWWSFGSQAKQMNQHYTFFEELNLPAEVRHKIYRGNAEKVYGLKK